VNKLEGYLFVHTARATKTGPVRHQTFPSISLSPIYTYAWHMERSINYELLEYAKVGSGLVLQYASVHIEQLYCGELISSVARGSRRGNGECVEQCLPMTFGNWHCRPCNFYPGPISPNPDLG
jgi:hypothetical protein